MITTYAHTTVVLKSLIENEQTYPLLNKALSTYPLYVGKKEYDLIPTREQLNKKFLDHYKYREIGFETVGRFLDELEITFNEIMPYYNELFKSVEIMADLENPFDNVDIVEKLEQKTTNRGTNSGETTSEQSASNSEESSNTSESSGESSNSNSGKLKRKYSDTPQNNVDDIDNYLTNYTDEETTNNGTSNDSSNTKGSSSTSGESSANSKVNNTGSTTSEGELEHTFTKKGNQGVNTYAHDMNEFRTSIIDVVDKILNDKRVNELFMLVW